MDVGDDRDTQRRATLAKALVTIVPVAGWLVVAALLWRTKTPPLDLPSLAPEQYFSREELGRIERFRSVTRGFWALSLLAEMGVLALLAWQARPLASLLSGPTGGRFRTGVALALLAAAAVWVATLPVGALAHWWRRRYGLSEQAYPGWLADRALSLAVTAVLVAVAVAVALALAGRFARDWWLPGALAFAALAAVFAVAQPVVVHPLFNRFAPLADARLSARIETIGERMGVRVETVQVADASRRTTTANAYVAGIGPTRRVVFYDTILDGRFAPDELAAVAAHELAHVERSHPWKWVGWFALLALPGLFLVARASERVGGLAEPASVPLALLVATAFFLASLPLQNAVSRRYEAEADWLALEATRDPGSAVSLEEQLVKTALADPDPPAWVTVVLATHPPPLERIAMAEAFAAKARLVEP